MGNLSVCGTIGQFSEGTMKIAAVQSRPTVGPVEGNLPQHQHLIELSIQHGADLIVFPELSLTGYEPKLAAQLARVPTDSCFDIFRDLSDAHNVTICVGVPLTGVDLPTISCLIFRPRVEVQTYSKRYLHSDELPYFRPGTCDGVLISTAPNVALAICYELSVEEHRRWAVEAGATVYVASVAKSRRGIEATEARMSEFSQHSSLSVLVANCLGTLDDTPCVGHSSAWDCQGRLIARMDAERVGLILKDCRSGDA